MLSSFAVDVCSWNASRVLFFKLDASQPPVLSMVGAVLDNLLSCRLWTQFAARGVL